MILCAFKNAYVYLRNLLNNLINKPNNVVTIKKPKIHIQIVFNNPNINSGVGFSKFSKDKEVTDAINQLSFSFISGISSTCGFGCCISVDLHQSVIACISV